MQAYYGATTVPAVDAPDVLINWSLESLGFLSDGAGRGRVGGDASTVSGVWGAMYRSDYETC